MMERETSMSNQSNSQHRSVIILGSGPAGYTAAIYAARANLQPLLIQGMQPGGQLTVTTEVDNFPGFEHGVQGPELMQKMQAQAERFNTTIVFDTIVKTELGQKPFLLVGDSGESYSCDALIIATGASARWLGIESEQRLSGFGVSACATCDGFFYKGREVAVVGGGDAAVEESLYLTNFCTKVYLIHRRDRLRAERIMQDRLLANPKIEMVWNATVDEILGDAAAGGVTGVRVRDVQNGTTREIAIHGLFVAIGHTPNTAIFGDQLEKDAMGYLITKPDSTATNIPGVFAAGDVQDRIFRQAITAAGSGCMAALEAERYLSGHEDSRK
ncbi:MAG: thioredoxin-disulfide reductase [Magnetococcales bacterium]|nr:thioredoxin-disulfide reductase [Magnetococcales bacterium]